MKYFYIDTNNYICTYICMSTEPRTRRPNPSVRSVSAAGGLIVYEALSY